ncbi:ArdC-like ssDNA-binding domain-containing protein [Natrinema salinisoli]|uniref:ArdC-like ssDNA-binding domain-containing protein n=1 Tax=Natrinema salinisoli TaxID=2878535 RepID=UPI001CF0173A|nr:ArdC-like ssDNA-binding domain-containing protein [Natrinema salinisoli]
MSTTRDSSVSFEQTDTRSDEMNSTIEQWIDELVAGVDDAQASDEFQEWLDVQSRFHDYSYRNTLLIKRQCPEATRVAGYRTWQEEFDRHVQEGESAIWIWAPIITKQCPECENSPSYHEDSDCDYDETPPEKWSKGLVGFKPTPVFDISQTEGESLPDLDTEATGDAGDLVAQLTETADELGVTVRIVPREEWTHGGAKGVCEQLSLFDVQPLVEVRDRENDADLARTLIHEYAHALLHFDVNDDTELSKREVEAEAVAYVVGRYFGLDTSGSAFYLAAWESDDPEVVRNRLERISRTAEEIIDAVDEVTEDE